MTEIQDYRKEAKQAYSRIGLGLLTAMALHFFLDLGFDIIAGRQGLVLEPWLTMLLNGIVFNYLSAFLGYLVYRGLPRFSFEKRAYPIPQFLKLPFITLFLSFFGQIVFFCLLGIFALIVSLVTGGGPDAAAEGESIIESFQEVPTPLSFLFTVLLGPIVEELICRKSVIDRTRVYGEKVAVISSALIFGIFHTNFQQLFYTAFMGLTFAYVYAKTGRLIYSVILHIINNFLAFVYQRIPLSDLLTSLQSGQLSGADGLKLAVFPVFGILILLGLVFLIRERKKIRFEPQGRDLPERGGLRTVWLSLGMVLFTIIGLIFGMG